MKRLSIILLGLFIACNSFAKDINNESLNQYKTKLEDSINNYLGQEEYLNAIPLVEEHLNVVSKIYGKNSKEYAVNLFNAADIYAWVSDYDNAIKLAEELLKVNESVFGKKHSEYAISLYLLGIYYNEIGNFDKATECQYRALDIFRDQEGLESENYIIALCNIIRICISNNNLYRLDMLLPSIFEVFDIILDDNSLLIESLSNYYAVNGRIQNVLQIYNKWLNSISREYGEKTEAYASDLKYFAEKCFNIGEYSQAIEYASQSSKLYKILFSENNEKYIETLMSLSGYNFYVGRYSDAIKYGEQAVDLIFENYGETNPNFPITLDNLSRFYSAIGDYNKALEYGEKAHKLFDKNSFDYAISTSNLAGIYHGLGEIKKALELETVSHELISKLNVNGDYQRNYITSTYALSTYLRENNKIEDAKACALEVLSLAQKEYGLNHPRLADYFNNVAMCYYGLGKYNDAITYETNAILIIEKTLGSQHPNYVNYTHNLSTMHYGKGDLKTAMKYISKTSQLYNNEIISQFSTFTRSQRELFWSKRNQWYGMILMLSYMHPQSISIEETYNSVLLSKGILLNSEIEFSKLIAESGDEEANALYSELQQKRRFLNKLYEIPIAERKFDAESIEKEAETLERELIEKSKVYGDFTHNLNIDWKQVQSALTDDDIAIEFVSFPTKSDSIMYCALTLKKGYELPRMIELFEAKQLSVIEPEDYYVTPKISNLVWKPLAEELSDVKDIYFAPAGELYNIAIESLKDFDGDGYIFDNWNFYRLSSTRELSLIKEDKNDTNVALYGGIKYDADDFAFEQNPIENYNNYYATTRSLSDSIGLRAGKRYLQYTLIEVEHIDSLYSHKSIPTQLYTGLVGSETSIKRLSGKNLSNLHISTHGFYWSESKINSDKDLHHLKFLRQDESPRLVEDKAMTRSGLLFAGANAVLQGDSIPEGCDDGILTAQEIAALDFRGLDLLVLSACQTGLGEIKGDGVFGLQRGFKKAGVQSIVMSLWKVNDDATQKLMVEFYHNLLNGETKAESLLNAQKVVRETRGWQDPYYWAGFILLDGLN